MTRYELLKLNQSLLHTLLENNISPREVQNMEIYEAFNEMVAKKHKVTYIVTHLADTYGLKERAIYTLVKRFNAKIRL